MNLAHNVNQFSDLIKINILHNAIFKLLGFQKDVDNKVLWIKWRQAGPYLPVKYFRGLFIKSINSKFLILIFLVYISLDLNINIFKIDFFLLSSVSVKLKFLIFSITMFYNINIITIAWKAISWLTHHFKGIKAVGEADCEEKYVNREEDSQEKKKKSFLVQPVNLPLAMFIFSIRVHGSRWSWLLLTQLLANGPGKEAVDGSKTWVPATQVGDPDGLCISWF